MRSAFVKTVFRDFPSTFDFGTSNKMRSSIIETEFIDFINVLELSKAIAGVLRDAVVINKRLISIGSNILKLFFSKKLST